VECEDIKLQVVLRRNSVVKHKPKVLVVGVDQAANTLTLTSSSFLSKNLGKPSQRIFFKKVLKQIDSVPIFVGPETKVHYLIADVR
jgi:hypothetical protein